MPGGGVRLGQSAFTAPMTRRVLATDAQERSVLATLRCLSQAGYEVTAVACTRAAPGFWSRASSARRLGPDPRDDLAGFVESLQQILRERRHDVVLPGTDAALLAISRHREGLARYARLGLPGKQIVEGALDRERLGEAASSAGLARPDERVCANLEEALEAAARFGYPLLAKPIQTVVERQGGADRRASVLARNERALASVVRSFGGCIVQRRLRGSVISFAGVATETGLLGFVVSRYARTWPPDAGNVCFSETVAAPPGLADRVEALVARLQWVGLFELELIEAADGRFAAIDFNPRAYGSMSLAVAAGVPLPALWCGWLFGERGRPRCTPRLGVRYRWGEADLSNAVWRLRGGAELTALGSLRPHKGVVHPYFQRADPVPAAARAVQLIHKGWRAVRGGRRAISFESEAPQRSSTR
jgi:predicted ATP-grasp superfamily ATP-dependent carboligase